MKNRARADITSITIMTIAAMLVSVACAPHAEVALASTPEPIITATAVPTVTPTPTLSPVPTPTPIFSEERMAELNKQFLDFLNKEGEFTPEKTQEMMMVTTSSLDNDKVGLGITDYQPRIQGYFFDYYEKDNRLILLMGFDGKDSNRFITPVEIPIYISEVAGDSWFTVIKFKDNYVFSARFEGDLFYGERAKLIPVLNTAKGKVIAILLNVDTYSKEGAGDDEYSRIVCGYIDEVNPKVDLSFGLFQLIPSNDIEYDWEDQNGDSDSILKIMSCDDISNINISDVPIMHSIAYFAGEDE